MISLNNDVWTPSEGRGHRFESCRVHQFFNDLGAFVFPRMENTGGGRNLQLVFMGETLLPQWPRADMA